jgi:hypothetical protein
VTSDPTSVTLNNPSPPAPGGPIPLAANTRRLFNWNVDPQTGQLSAPDSIWHDGLTNPSEISTRAGQSGTSEFFATYAGSDDVAKYNVSASGALSFAASYRFSKDVFGAGISRDGCPAVPVQGDGAVRGLTNDVVPTNSITWPGSFPTNVVFNPANSMGYVTDGSRIRFIQSSPTCTLIAFDTTLTVNNLRHVQVDPDGDHLFALTFNPFGSASTLVLQPLLAGLPAGNATTFPLPAGAFRLGLHPELNVVYALQSAPNAGILPVSYDPNTHVMNGGTPYLGPVADEIEIPAGGNWIYWKDVGIASQGRIGQAALTETGEITGSWTIHTQPSRLLDQDIQLLVRPDFQ